MNYYSLKLFSVRHAITAGLSVFAAYIINHYYSFSHEYWMVLSAFLVSQTTRGTPVKQGVFIFITTLLAVIISAFLLDNLNHTNLLKIILSVLLIASGFLAFIKRPQPNKVYFLIILFSLIVFISALSPVKSAEFMLNRILDVMVGASVAIVFALIILPVKLAVEFSEGVIPVLNCLKEYSQVLLESLSGLEDKIKDTSAMRIKLENILVLQSAMYPEWVYEVGFNRGLRSGFRFFLVNIERIAEVYFSMDYLISRGIDATLVHDLFSLIESATQKNQELLSILLEYFKNHKISNTGSDFTSDIQELEKALHRVVPDNIEALEVSPSFLLITAYLRDMKDLRGLLLQLVMALQLHNVTK